MKIAVQVIPPSHGLILLKVPFAAIRFALVKPVTASEKVIVTVDVSPAFKAVFVTVMFAVGATPSITISLLSPSEPAELGVGRIKLTLAPSAWIDALSFMLRAPVLA